MYSQTKGIVKYVLQEFQVEDSVMNDTEGCWQYKLLSVTTAVMPALCTI